MKSNDLLTDSRPFTPYQLLLNGILDASSDVSPAGIVQETTNFSHPATHFDPTTKELLDMDTLKKIMEAARGQPARINQPGTGRREGAERARVRAQGVAALGGE